MTTIIYTHTHTYIPTELCKELPLNASHVFYPEARNKSWGYLASSFGSVVNSVTLEKSFIFPSPRISHLKWIAKISNSSLKDMLVVFLGNSVCYMCVCVCVSVWVCTYTHMSTEYEVSDVLKIKLLLKSFIERYCEFSPVWQEETDTMRASSSQLQDPLVQTV